MIVVLTKQGDRHHDVVYVSEDQGPAGSVLFFGFEKAERMIAPVTTWVQVVRCVPAVVEAESITLMND